MTQVKAIGFDLFDTLIMPDYSIIGDAMTALLESLEESGFAFDKASFSKAYGEAALFHMKQARKEGRETHNRLWISDALHVLGFDVAPEDARVSAAVDSYFALFYPSSRLIPGTVEMLEQLEGRYRIGLLSNFTYAPAARELVTRAGLTRFFDAIFISDEMGLRKPRVEVFDTLVESLGVGKDQTIYVGDDPVADVQGAQEAGLFPVWTTIVQDQKLAPTRNPFSPKTKVPDGRIPRISAWKDLFVLLDSI